MPDGEPAPGAPAGKPQTSRSHLLFGAPPTPVAAALVVAVSLLAAAVLARPFGLPYVEEFLYVFAGPALIAGVATPPLVAAFGGRFELRRSLLLSLLVVGIELPLAAAWRAGAMEWPTVVPPLVLVVPFLAGPAFWFRHLSLFGVSRSSHARMLPASLLAPILALIGAFAIAPPTARTLAVAGASLAIGFVCALAVLSASDRPIRREFQSSGVALIRPLLDHVGERDPEATRRLEEFFLRVTVRADLRVDLFAFDRAGRTRATVALPTVHPGPFAALGASDLPRKLAEALGASGGIVLVPHTPSDHDLDLPSEAEVARVAAACRSLLAGGATAMPPVASPLVLPYPGSLARAQILGGVALVLVSQAPAPTDDIAFSVADRIVRELGRETGLRIVMIDAHNSYIEGQGDISYGGPTAEKLLADARAAVAQARARAVDGPVEVGVAERGGYSIGRDGIGPTGLRAIAVRAAGTTSGLVLIDGNNLVVGKRAPIVAALEGAVDAAEVLTTDNHVVHEVDGGINPVGERYPEAALVADARAVLDAAVRDLAPAEIRFGSQPVPDVPVLGPGYTARLLTSLGDTLGVFTHMFAASFLLLLTGSLVVALLVR